MTKAFADETVYIDRSGGISETKLPDGTIVEKDDPDEVYAAVQRWAMKNHKPVKVVDMQKGKTMMIDRDGNIDDVDEPQAAEAGSSPLMMRRDYGSKDAAEPSEPSEPSEDSEDSKLKAYKTVVEALKNSPELVTALKTVFDLSLPDKKYLPAATAGRIYDILRGMGLSNFLDKKAGENPLDPKTISESMKDGPDFNETVRAMLNERLVSSMGEARRLAAEGYTVEELRAFRKGKNMAKGKWASSEAVKSLGVIADLLESHGMREAAEKVDILANTIESAALAGKPYVVEQLERAGFGVSRYPGDVEDLAESAKTLGDAKHHQTHMWIVSSPEGNVFDINGVDQDDVLLNTPGAGMKDEEFLGESTDDYKYLVYSSTPIRQTSNKKIILSSNKEQDLISKLKKLLKPEGVAKTAAKYLENDAAEGMTFPIHISDSHEHPELKKVFTWLSRHKMGPTFGSRPIGWYQMHQMAAIDVIEEAVKKLGATGEVRVEKGMLKAKKDGVWEDLMSCDEVYRMADSKSRK